MMYRVKSINQSGWIFVREFITWAGVEEYLAIPQQGRKIIIEEIED